MKLFKRVAVVYKSPGGKLVNSLHRLQVAGLGKGYAKRNQRPMHHELRSCYGDDAIAVMLAHC